ncbi:putative glycosyltransferase EpsF [Turicibacter faecis]|uniref:Glycosyltransferase EpsF n=1 Tax=Turicibacter faecis TaxID=2963365 RepID=A0ABM8IK54_9FIRM|nr:glycosyltransferase family 1 protein [Turicibacter sp. TS3]NCE77784.1 glycosyltransferase family 1 protein [Turicibacter sp. TS3]BEH91627.1 putative glycosyltransferase EpsF [Turicibacter sp. TC023]
MEPIRILQVVTAMNRGGLETMLMNYYRKLDKGLYQFDFLVHRQERGDYDDEIEELGGKIYRLSSIRPGHYKKYFKELDDFFSKHQEYRVVHAHINENSGFALRAAKKYGVPCRIAHSHLADLKLDYKYPFRWYGRRYLKPNANYYYACSDQAGQWLFGGMVEKSQIKVLPNAVDLDDFKMNPLIREETRRNLNLTDEFVIGHVGRFNPQKNHDFLIEVFNEIQKRCDKAVLLLVGEGYLEDKIKEKVKEMGLENKVRFLGLRKDIKSLMQAMDLFLFPSLFEGLPVVLVEAQASGLKCVTSTGVTSEANLCGEVEFIDLNEGASQWAEKILSLNYDKKDYTDILTQKGYSSNQSSAELLKFYLEFYKG